MMDLSMLLIYREQNLITCWSYVGEIKQKDWKLEKKNCKIEGETGYEVSI